MDLKKILAKFEPTLKEVPAPKDPKGHRIVDPYYTSELYNVQVLWANFV